MNRSTSNVEMTNKGANDEKHNTAGSNSEMNKKTQSEECRACLQPTGSQTAYSLFESWVTPWAVRGAIIADDLSKFADVEISEYDKYSKVICSKCYSRLSDACTFMITVQMSDSILRQRVENSDSNTAGEVGTSWPQPILLNKSKDIDGDNNIEVEVKQEVLSDDNAEENEADMDQDWEPTMDIKIEPEEITAPVQSIAQVNGIPDGIRDEIPNLVEITDTSSKHKQDDSMDRVIKQEPLSEDELLEPMPDLPLDCMLCSKVFHTMSGLKAHVISQHSYKSVKRKAVGGPSPVKNKVQVKEHVCNLCNQSFSTTTDLMVHGASHSEHVCYVCDRKFNSFQQLMRHTPRCQKKHASAHRRDHTRFVLRPQQSQPVKESIKAQEPPACPEEVTQELSQPLKNTLKPENPPTRMEKTKPKSEMPVIKDVASVTVSPVIKALARTESKSLAIDMLATESEVLATKAMTVIESERSKTEDMVATESESLAIEPMMVIKLERPVIEPMEVTKSENPIIEVMVATKSESPVKEAIVAIEYESPTVEAIVATESKSPAVEAIVATESKNPAIDEMIATKSESPAIEDMIAERVQELVETWPSTEEMDMDIELSQTHSENKLEYKPQVPLGKEQQNYDISSEKDLEMRLSAIFNGPCLISTKVEMEIKPSIEITQKSGQESKSSHSQVEIEESSQKQVESSLIETQKCIREETKVQKEAQNELSCDTTYVESIEEIQRESITESPMQDLEIALAKTSDKPDSSEDIPSTFLEDKISNSLHNINEDGLSLPKVLSETQNESNFLSESQNYRNFISESVPSLPKQDDSKEIFINYTSETLKESYNLATGEEIEQTIEENVDLENSTQNNLDNNDVPGTKTLDDISEMKVHLAINPLNKDTVIFEAEAEGIEHGESESCEPILVSLISEQSDIKHT